MRHSEGDPIMTQGEGQDVSDRYQAGGGPALRDCEHPAYAMLAVRDDEYDRLDAGPAKSGDALPPRCLRSCAGEDRRTVRRSGPLGRMH